MSSRIFSWISGVSMRRLTTSLPVFAAGFASSAAEVAVFAAFEGFAAGAGAGAAAVFGV
jgi:hypothetical protein